MASSAHYTSSLLLSAFCCFCSASVDNNHRLFRDHKRAEARPCNDVILYRRCVKLCSRGAIIPRRRRRRSGQLAKERTTCSSSSALILVPLFRPSRQSEQLLCDRLYPISSRDCAVAQTLTAKTAKRSRVSGKIAPPSVLLVGALVLISCQRRTGRLACLPARLPVCSREREARLREENLSPS